MKDNSENNYNKIFDNIINSNNLQNVYENINKEETMTLKEVVLLQQELASAVANISDMIFCNVHLGFDLEMSFDSLMHNLMASLYKVALDFNEVVVELLGEEDNITLNEDEEDDDDK
jgi:hypothetical protein